MPLEEQSALRLDSGTWKFFPKRNDAFIQRFNPFVTRVWRGNTDFSAITSKDAVLNYIAKYASKGEHASEAYSEILRRVVNRNSPDTPAATLIRQLLVSSVAERNYSAQEVMHLLLGWPLFHASRSIIVLSVRDDWRQFGQRPNNSLLSRYPARPPNLNNITLLEYAKKYRIVTGGEVQRKKECVVRVIPHLKLTDNNELNEEYYKIQCMLHIPWRNNFEDLLPRNSNWQDFFLANNIDIDNSDEFAEEFPHNPDEFEFEEIDEPDYIVRDADLVAARIHPGSYNSDPLGHRPVDEAHDWQVTRSADITETQINEFLRSLRNAPLTVRARIPSVDFELMSLAQQEVMQICRQQVEDLGAPIKRVLVQGKAGTGKSAVIQAMCNLITETQVSTEKSFQVVAPTGAAALNVDGKTIHSFFQIPIQGQMPPLNGESLRNFQLKLKDIRFVIIDEYSMIGFRLLHKIHKRLCEARGAAEQPFGGYNIHLFGDLRQLPPVKDTPIYNEPTDDFTRLSLRLVYSMQKRIILTHCYRQNASQAEFIRVLDNIATGNVTEADWLLLITRRASINPSNANEFLNAIRLFPKNDQVSEYNTHVLSNNRNPVAIILAVHNNATARQGSDDIAQGLSRKLYLTLDCRIMLRKNLFVERGLVNGSLGTVRDIIYNPGETPPALPSVILIEFDRYDGPFLQDRLFPILPVVANWKDQSIDCSRKQFPLSLAYALTIHKSQGLTLDKTVVDIGDKEMSSGLTYVALSRVRKLDDILFSTTFNFTRLSSIRQSRGFAARERFLNSSFPTR